MYALSHFHCECDFLGKECKFIKSRQLLDSFSTPPIYRGLRISEFKYDFLGIHEYVFGPSFLLTLDI